MKKPMIIGISVVAVLVAAGVAYATISNKPESTKEAVKMESSESKTASETATPEQAPAAATPAQPSKQQSTPATATPGKYADYSASSLASTGGTRIIFFHASWCPQCRQLDASIKAGKVPDNVTIFKTDYDSNQALRQKYGVTIQTTVVLVDANGNLVKKYVAYDNPTLKSVTDNLL
jgi:thiol-disulfide isomerase/thioredoxin